MQGIGCRGRVVTRRKDRCQCRNVEEQGNAVDALRSRIPFAPAFPMEMAVTRAPVARYTSWKIYSFSRESWRSSPVVCKEFVVLGLGEDVRERDLGQVAVRRGNQTCGNIPHSLPAQCRRPTWTRAAPKQDLPQLLSSFNLDQT